MLVARRHRLIIKLVLISHYPCEQSFLFIETAPTSAATHPDDVEAHYNHKL